MNKLRNILTRTCWMSVAAMLLALPIELFANQYRSRQTGNWNDVTVPTTWEISVNGGATWANATASYPGSAASTDTVLLQNGFNITLNVSPANSLASLTLAGGNTATSLTFGATTNTLTVVGAITMNAGTGNGDNRTITVAAGRLNAGSVSMANTGADNIDCIISLTTGTITIAGNLAMPGTFARNHIDITGAGTINIGGNISNGAGAVGGGFTNPPGTSTINLNGSSAQTVFLYGGASALDTVKINNAAGVTSGSAFSTAILTIGDVTPNSVFNDGGFQVTSTGTLNLTSGTFVLGSAGTATTFPAFAARNIAAGTTVEYAAGVAQTVSTTPVYSNVVLSGAGTKTSAAGTLTVGGNWTNNGSTFVPGANTVTFNGTGAQSIGGTAASQTFYNFTINKTAGQVLSVGGSTTTLTVGGAFTQTQGDFIAPSAMNVAGNWSAETGTTFTPGSGMVTFNGTGAQQILGTAATKTFNNVIIDKTAGTLLSAAGGTTTIVINGSFTQTLGNFTPPATLNVGGDWTRNGGTFTAGTGTVTFDGSSAQSINGSATTTFYNLTLNNAAGATLTSNTTVSNILTLTAGVLQLGDYNLILSSTAAGAIAGAPFSVSKMIQTDGTGYIEKSFGTNPSGVNFTYPVGAGGYYNPFGLTGFSATGTGTIRTTAVTANQGSNALSKYWTVTVTGTYAGITTNVRFTYDVAEVRGVQSQYDSWYYNGTWSSAPGTHTSLGSNPFGSDLSGVTAASISGRWSAGSTAPATSVSFYSYQSGNWTNATSWTSDPSGTLWINPGVPGNSDNATILNGRTITISANTKQVASLTLNSGGILDIGSTTGHNFGTVSGQGKLMLSSNTLPGGTFGSLVASNGGTIEYYNVNGAIPDNSPLGYNNLIISNSSASNNTVYLSSGAVYQINGNFSLKKYSSGNPTLNFGNPTPSNLLLNLTVFGNFIVDAGCSIGVNNFQTAQNIPHPIAAPALPPTPADYPAHVFSLYGNFTNNGTVRFTVLGSPAIPAYYTLSTTNGAVQVYFKGATNNSVTCNGITDFFRLIVEKGTDKTYTLEVSSSSTSNFALYAPNDQGGANGTSFDGPPEGFAYGAYYKALFIHYGTLKLNENINIPSLTEGGQDFNVIPTAKLWINGATVSTTVSGVNGTGYQAATLYGSLTISAGTFSTGDAAGIVLGTLGTPTIRVEGTGTLDVSQAWTSTGGSNQMSYIQTGGTANFRMQGENHAGPMLNLSNVNAVFIMSGGAMNFEYNTFADASFNYNILDIQCQAGNYELTGGTLNFNLPSSATSYTANSTIPFYNLNISRRTGAGTVTVQWNTPGSTLSLLNDLTINGNSTLNLNTSLIDLAVGGDFIIAAGGTYSPATGVANTTTFNGAGAQSFSNIGTITGGMLNNLTVANSSVTSIISNDLTVNRTLSIGSNAVLNDSGRYVNVRGNILNSGTHTSQLSAGGLRINGTVAQTIDGDGTGIFNHLIIDKTAGTISLLANVSLTGNLRLITSANFNIGSKSLSLGVNSNVYTDLVTAQNYDNTHMVYTNGLPSDGGVSKAFDASHKTFLYPIGTGTSYRPARIQFVIDPTQYGSIAVRPVLSAHPLVQAANTAINLYWKTTSSGFTGLQSNSINQVYYYYAADAQPANEVNYRPATYIAPSWNSISDTLLVDETLTPREIHFNTVNYINGEYTTGTAAAFTGLATYYSNSNNVNVTSPAGADWNAANTWCTGGHTGTPVGALADNMSNAAFVIGDGSSTVHTINITGAHQISTGNITVRSDGVLDIAATSNHNFGAVISDVSGNGMLRISSNNYFPRGDWADFLNSAGGTVEYYQTGTGTLNLPSTYLLPGGGTANIVSYYNLTTLPYNASNIILPNTDLTIHNDLTVGYSAGGGTTNCITQLNAGGATTTLEVEGDIAITQYGILQFMNNTAQNVIADNSITIASGGAFQVSALGTAVANSLTVYGSITNNGTLDLYPNTLYCDLIFTGNSNKSLSGTPTQTRLYSISVDIGSSKDSVLNVNVGAAGFQMRDNGLVLLNGTFRLTTPVTMNLSAGSFTIPAATSLSANGGTLNVATGAGPADLNLNGRLEVLAGAVNVGPAISSASANAFNIIYSAAGTPEIIVAGGALSVYSQIRREAILTSGALNYTQSGGTVTIGAKNANTVRAAFEVLNTGSRFVMSNGTLIVANHVTASAPYDVTLEAAVSTVTGGTVQFGLTGVTPNQTLFYLQSSNTINNLTLEATANARAIQQTHALHLSGSLTIGGALSYYNANGLDVFIGGNVTNNNTEAASNGLTIGGYRTQLVSQTTTLNGTADRTITGTASNRTNFANLVIAPSAGRTVYLSSGACNITVNGNLTLSSGTLDDGSNTIYLLGNVSNSAVHYSPNGTTGGMLFTGTANQGINGSGTGVFGNIEINNGSNDVNMTNNTKINGQLKFTNGHLYIDDYALTLGADATIAGTVNASNMVLLNGVSSDQGVTKIFRTGSANFTFPVGSNGKYTPCTFDFSSNSNPDGATIKVIPVDDLHSTVDPGFYSNYLNYYWSVTTTGFSSSFDVTQSYTYISTDVAGTPANIERYNTGQWTTVTGSISSPTFSFDSDSLLDGSYTIGDQFADLPVITSAQSGNWNTPATWDLNVVPNGNPVVIRSIDSVALSANGASAASVTINGVLDAVNTTFHSLGEVSGNGKIKLLSTGSGMFVFPAGSYDDFFADPSSTVEFYGSSNGTLPLDVGDITKPYQHVIFSGAGIKYISSVDMKVIGNATFMAGSKLDNSLYNKDLYILGNWIDNNTGTAAFTAGTGAVRFSGTALQNIMMANNTMTETFYNLAINNAAGLTIQTGKAVVSNQLILTLGNINTNSTNTLTIDNTGTNAIVGSGVHSFVNGPLSKRIINGSNFQFPVGDAVSSSRNRIGYVSVINTSTTGTQTWTAQFFDKNPTTGGYDISQLASPLNWLANNEYWNVTGPAGGSANVVLSWDSYTGMSSSASSRAQAKVAEWNTPVASKWNGITSTVSDFGRDSGTVSTTALLSIVGSHIFTISAAVAPVGTLVWAIQTGLWNTPSIWNTGFVPGPLDTVSVGNPYTVTLDVAPTITKFLLTGGGTLVDAGLTMTIVGNILLDGTWSGTGTLSWTTDDDTLTGTGSMNGTSTLQVDGNKLIAANANVALASVSIASNKTLTNTGTATIQTVTGVDGTASWINAANSTLNVSGALMPTGIISASAAPNTVVYNGSGAQTVKAMTYHHLTFSGTGTKISGGALNVNGNLSIGSGATFNASSTSNTVYGNWINDGTFTASTSTIILAGTSASSISGATAFSTLELNKADSATAVTLSNNIQVANLTMTSGTLRTGSNSVTITNNRTGNGIILGTITRTHTFNLATAYAFEGANNTLTFDSASALPTSVTIVVDTVSPGVNDYMEPVDRYYTISQTGGSGFIYTLRLQYRNAEVASPNYKSTLKMWRRNSTGPDVWDRWGASAVDSVSYWVEMTNINTMGTWGLSSRKVPNIALTLSASAVNPVPGDTVTYSIAYSNIGDGNATNTIVSASAPLLTAYVANSVVVNTVGINDNTGGVTVNSGNISVNLQTIVGGPLTPGANGTITYKVIIN